MLDARLHFHNVELCLLILDFNQLANMLGFGVVPFFTLNQGYQSLDRIFDLGRKVLDMFPTLSILSSPLDPSPLCAALSRRSMPRDFVTILCP